MRTKPPPVVIGGVEFARGSYEEARAMLGARTAPARGDVAVNRTTILQFASAVEDANPSFWDEEFAAETWGGIPAPPAMLPVWTFRLRWHPDGSGQGALLMCSVPLPGDNVVNAGNEVEFLLPILEGDHLTIEEELLDVSAEKSTKLGAGHFVTTSAVFRRDDGEVVARQTNTIFRFGRGA